MLTSALFAGLAAGVIASVLHLAMLVPIIVNAEQYETGQLTHFSAALDQKAPVPALKEALDRSLWHRDTNRMHRGLMTFGAELVTYTGFALLLIALFAIAEKYGLRITVRQGVLWGLAGFFAVHLAPAAGLPPETPGIPAAGLGARQLWWIATVLATGTGLAMLAFGRSLILPIAGGLLIALPHLVGAPQIAEMAGVVPPSLEGQFVARSLASAAVIWITLGLLCGYFWTKQAAGRPPLNHVA